LIHRHVFHNDQLLPIEKVRLSPGQAGLVNGWGLFTTLRIVRGEADLDDMMPEFIHDYLLEMWK